MLVHWYMREGNTLVHPYNRTSPGQHSSITTIALGLTQTIPTFVHWYIPTIRQYSDETWATLVRLYTTFFTPHSLTIHAYHDPKFVRLYRPTIVHLSPF